MNVVRAVLEHVEVSSDDAAKTQAYLEIERPGKFVVLLVNIGPEEQPHTALERINTLALEQSLVDLRVQSAMPCRWMREPYIPSVFRYYMSSLQRTVVIGDEAAHITPN